MSNQTLSTESIQATKTYQSLNAIQKEFIVKRANRLLLSNAIIVHRNTGVVPGNITGYNVGLLNEIILGESAKFDELKSDQK